MHPLDEYFKFTPTFCIHVKITQFSRSKLTKIFWYVLIYLQFKKAFSFFFFMNTTK